MSRVYNEIDPSYAASCSDITLYSNPKGFFKSFAEEILELASEDEWLSNEFEQKVGDSNKIEAVLVNNKLMEAITEVMSRIQPLYRGKDGRICLERRAEAEKSLDNGETTKAFALACQAVLKAPLTGELEMLEGGVSLALSLWQRSEILLKIGKPTAALEDLKAALKERLPAKMRAQYYWRMGLCYKGAGEPTRAKVSFELALRLLGKDEEERQKLTKDIESLKGMAEQNIVTEKSKDITVSAGPKQNMPCLSKLVKITEEQHKGRFAVANSNIKAGDIILVENPYAACLLPDCYGTHCLHCFKRLSDCKDSSPVWCNKCSGVAFCSFQCRDAALATYHPYECQFTDLFIGSGMSILSLIALRMVTQAGLETSLSIHSKYLSNDIKTVEGSIVNDIEGSAKKAKMKSRKERLHRSKKALNNNDKEQPDENNFKEETNFKENIELKASQIYSLCTHSEQRSSSDYLKRILMAIFLTECLKKTEFFKKTPSEDLLKQEKSIRELILCNLQLLQFNAHELYETVRGKHQFSGSKAVYMAVGIYPTGALFNHECYPAVARYFDGRRIVLRCTRPLSVGEVISENYGPHFLVRSLKDRQRSLSCRYWFMCKCQACIEDWPLLKDMTDTPPYYKCISKECPKSFKLNSNIPEKCEKCLAEIKEHIKMSVGIVKESEKQYKDGARLMDEEKVNEALSTMTSAINSFCSVAKPPHRKTHLAQESLRTCFAASGNVHIVSNNE